MESFVRVPNTPPFGSASRSHPSAVPYDRPAPPDERVARARRRVTPTSMPATYCPQCGRTVATLDGRRITHQVPFTRDSARAGGRAERLMTRRRRRRSAWEGCEYQSSGPRGRLHKCTLMVGWPAPPGSAAGVTTRRRRGVGPRPGGGFQGTTRLEGHPILGGEANAAPSTGTAPNGSARW